MRCNYCHKELPLEAHGKQSYCNNAHKQAHYRQRVKLNQQEKAVLIEQIEALSAQVNEQEAEIAQLERTISLLKHQMNLEYRYLVDTQARGFIPFLRRQPATPFIQKLLADQSFTFNHQASRWTYEQLLRFKMLCTDEELEQFKQLWKLMILETYSVDL
jgi:hypothetical protein